MAANTAYEIKLTCNRGDLYTVVRTISVFRNVAPTPVTTGQPVYYACEEIQKEMTASGPGGLTWFGPQGTEVGSGSTINIIGVQQN